MTNPFALRVAPYSLEALPDLIGERDLRILVEAIDPKWMEQNEGRLPSGPELAFLIEKTSERKRFQVLQRASS